MVKMKDAPRTTVETKTVRSRTGSGNSEKSWLTMTVTRLAKWSKTSEMERSDRMRMSEKDMVSAVQVGVGVGVGVGCGVGLGWSWQRAAVGLVAPQAFVGCGVGVGVGFGLAQGWGWT